MIMANGSLKERRPVETGPKIIGGEGSIYIHQRELWYVLVGRILLCVIWRSVCFGVKCIISVVLAILLGIIPIVSLILSLLAVIDGRIAWNTFVPFILAWCLLQDKEKKTLFFEHAPATRIATLLFWGALHCILLIIAVSYYPEDLVAKFFWGR